MRKTTISSHGVAAIIALILANPANGEKKPSEVAPAFDKPSGEDVEAGDQDKDIQAGAQPDTSPDTMNDSVDDIFKQVFGKQRPALGKDDYGVLIEDINVGTYLVTPDDGDRQGSVDAGFVSNVLAPTTIDETASLLRNLASGRDEVPFDALRELGLSVKFDRTQLVLRIEIPAAIRTVRNLNLRGISQRSDIDIVEQSDISGYISVRAGATFVEDSEFTPTGFDRFASDIDMALNLYGVVAEAELRYDNSRARKFTRGDVRLTYDDRDSLVRYELGDLNVATRPFQNAPNIAGISAYRNFSINPYLNIRPSPSQAFELDRPARVEVLLNGSLVRAFDLRSGRYNLRDFPLVPSAGNDIELRITYASGETETRIYPAFFDLELLAPGLVDFAFNMGLPYTNDNGVRRYDDNDYNGTGFVRYGLNSNLTVGLNWEGSRRFNLVGGEFVWALPFGTFGLNASTNLNNPGTDTGKVTLQYRWRDTDPAKERTIDGLVSLTGRNFQTLDQLFSDNLLSRQIRFRAGQKVGPVSRAQIYAGYEGYRGTLLSDVYYAGINYSRQLGIGSISVSAEYRKDQDGGGPVFRVGLSVPLGRGSLTSSYTTDDNVARVDYNRIASSGVNSFGYNASVERRDGSDRQLVRATYINNRFETSIQQIARNYFSDGNRDLRTEVTFGTALAMADGQFAIGRPIRNSFAIVKANKDAGDNQLAVEPRTGFGSSRTKYSAYSGALGPALLTTLTPYFNRSIQVDAPDAEAGTSLGGQVFGLNPGYRSGYNLEVGSARNVSVLGNMVDRDGDPLVFVTGLARDASILEESAEATQIFTNAKGRFFLEGVQAGRTYDITVTAAGQTATEAVAIPEGVTGIYELKAHLAYDLDFEAEGENDD
jgi:outer membrane usher protein